MDELKETTTWIPEKLPPKNIDDPEVTSNDTSATSSSGNDPLKPKIKKREVWGKKIDFLLACVGFSVGLGNVWRFPFLCYRNGGGAFLIPYFLAVIFCGIPCFFLEVCLGQFMAQGGVSAWKIVPLFQGIGFASCIIVFLLNCEYNIILTWALYYLFSSFNSVLPWSHGDNEWNSENCTTLYKQKAANLSNSLLNSTMGYVSSAVDNVTSVNSNMSNESSLKKLTCDPVTEFWERKVLSLSSGVDHPGAIKWDLALCLLLAWIIVYFCIWKGIKSSGKVMYFMATSPYIFMFVLLIRGVTLDGAELGLNYYLLTDWSKLLEPQVWVDAVTQIAFTYLLALGILTALGSYNKFHHNAFRDSIIFSCINSLTSTLAGLVIFSVLEFMAERQGVSVDDVAESGPGLAFIAYTEVVAQMPPATFWSVLYFVMILLLEHDSQNITVDEWHGAMSCFPCICDKGFFGNALTHYQCVDCMKCQEQNKEEIVPCTQDRDAQCGDCLDGYRKVNDVVCVIGVLDIEHDAVTDNRNTVIDMEHDGVKDNRNIEINRAELNQPELSNNDKQNVYIKHYYVQYGNNNSIYTNNPSDQNKNNLSDENNSSDEIV